MGNSPGTVLADCAIGSYFVAYLLVVIDTISHRWDSNGCIFVIGEGNTVPAGTYPGQQKYKLRKNGFRERSDRKTKALSINTYE